MEREVHARSIQVFIKTWFAISVLTARPSPLISKSPVGSSLTPVKSTLDLTVVNRGGDNLSQLAGTRSNSHTKNKPFILDHSSRIPTPISAPAHPAPTSRTHTCEKPPYPTP